MSANPPSTALTRILAELDRLVPHLDTERFGGKWWAVGKLLAEAKPLVGHGGFKAFKTAVARKHKKSDRTIDYALAIYKACGDEAGAKGLTLTRLLDTAEGGWKARTNESGTTSGGPSEYHPEAFWTTPKATHGLLDNEDFPGPVWEPCCGAGWVSEVLAARGHKVISTDIFDYGYRKQRRGSINFLTAAPPARFRSVVTNPPYSESRSFLARAWELGADKVAMMLPVDALHHIVEMGLPLKSMYFPRRTETKFPHADGRPACCNKWQPTWFVVERGYTGPGTFKRI